MDPEIGVPDGGWGWLVVTGTALINVFNQSLLSMFGLIFGAKLESLAGTTGVTTVMSVNCTISNFSGFLISPLSKYLSPRQITQIAVILVSVGVGISGFTDQYGRIIFGYGVLTGLGLGLIASSSFLIINSYFKRNKSQAVGFSMAGTSVGQMVMPPIVAVLLKTYGYSGTTLILAALSLHGLLGAMFFDPVEKHRKVGRNDRLSSLEGNGEDCESSATDAAEEDAFILCKKYATASHSRPNVHINVESPTVRERDAILPREGSDSEYEGSLRPKGCWQKLDDYFGLEILSDGTFVHIMIGLSLAYTTSVSFSTFFPLFLTEDLDMTTVEASTCMSALSLMDFIGRILVPFVTKQFTYSHRTIFIFGSVALVICRSILVFQTEYLMVVAVSALVGLARATTVINQNLVIAEYSKEAHVSSAIGLNMVSKGVFILTIGRLLGFYKDSAHNYGACIHILNIISTTVVVSWTLETIIKKAARAWRNTSDNHL